jgi:hypothetical protein
VADKRDSAKHLPAVMAVVIGVVLVTVNSVPDDWSFARMTLTAIVSGSVTAALAFVLITLCDRRHSN